MAEHPKSKSTGGFYRPDRSPCTKWNHFNTVSASLTSQILLHADEISIPFVIGEQGLLEVLRAEVDVVVALLRRLVDHVGFPRGDDPLLGQLAVLGAVEVGDAPHEPAVVGAACCRASSLEKEEIHMCVDFPKLSMCIGRYCISLIL